MPDVTAEAKPAPRPLAERVQASRARLVQQGGKRLPTGYLQPDAARALDALVSAGYAANATAVIARALVDAHAALTAGAGPKPLRAKTKAAPHPVQKTVPCKRP